ncbi:hypothetical protein ABZ791_00320 [Streptomyces huasconensis]|uniref:Uncharacterized protein n=1 Tax=Streptomyces huasconensis TaxID=1854574 RepID=A0ABV3LSX2_9ACTN
MATLSADPATGQEMSGSDPKLWRYDNEMKTSPSLRSVIVVAYVEA